MESLLVTVACRYMALMTHEMRVEEASRSLRISGGAFEGGKGREGRPRKVARSG